MIRKLFSHSILLVLTLVIASCIVHRVDIVPVDVSAETPILLSSPVKAHLIDGSTVVFPEGVNVYDGKVHGKGERFDIALENNRFVDEIALDDIAAMESFQTPVSTGATAAASTGRRDPAPAPKSSRRAARGRVSTYTMRTSSEPAQWSWARKRALARSTM